MTAMKYSVYALLAVVVGVMLVGMLPGQLSNLATPTREIATLQGASKGNGNVTLGGYGSTPSRSNNSTVSNDTAYSIVLTGNTTVASPASSAAIAAGTKTDAARTGAETAASAYNPLTDGKYYGMMGLGFIVALTVYFVAKRML